MRIKIDFGSFDGHTPGPWVAAWSGEEGDWGDGGCGHGLGVVAVGMGGICEMWPRIRSVEEMEANARLIAAAPHLLAEVERLQAENERLRRERKEM